MHIPISFVGFVKAQIEQQFLIFVSRGWEDWISSVARLRRGMRYNKVGGAAIGALGKLVTLVATGGVALIGPILTRGEN